MKSNLRKRFPGDRNTIVPTIADMFTGKPVPAFDRPVVKRKARPKATKPAKPFPESKHQMKFVFTGEGEAQKPASASLPASPETIGANDHKNMNPITVPLTSPVVSNASISDFWSYPAVIAETKFQSKSLSGWSFNTAIGCSHGCRFCYVPSVSTVNLAPQLAPMGVSDPDAEWGRYVFLRTWDEKAFMKSLRHADLVSRRDSLNGHAQAVMFSSTTDPYQVIPNPDPVRSRELTQANLTMVARALELIRDQSSLNVRILTRSPLARQHFDLFRSFGPRLLFGMSLPTLRNDLSAIYEPRAPAPSLRLHTLQKAKDAGLHVYVALAPTYPECDAADLRATMRAVMGIEPVTIFHEPINIRAENVARIASHAQLLGVTVNTAVFDSQKTWSEYALQSFQDVIDAAKEFGVCDRLHLWPDKRLGDAPVVAARTNPAAYLRWLNLNWNRVSEWPVVSPAIQAAVADSPTPLCQP